MDTLYDFAVIGGGASGLACAIQHKTEYPSDSVVIFEKNNRVGKKILVTGNGRCNLTNLNALPDDYNDSDFVKKAFELFSPENNIEFFKTIGLLCVADSERRVYPHSNTAAGVLNCLRFECERLGIGFVLDTAVTKVEKKDCFIINGIYKSKTLVIAVGGASSSMHGSDGSGYDLLKSLGHTVVSPSPSLVQLKTDTTYIKSLKGLRVKASVRLTKNNKVTGESNGEVLFTDYGLSGIAILDLSVYYARDKDKSGFEIHLDMAENYSFDELYSYLSGQISRNKNAPVSNILSCILPTKIGESVIKRAVKSNNNIASDLKDGRIKELVSLIKDFSLTVTGSRGFDMSQVTAGGARLDEFDKDTLQSKKIKGLYCAGEILDIDSRCGGFNLQWAWSSGRLAGSAHN